MRRKMEAGEKRNKIIGIKVQPDTHQKLEYIAKRECTTLSSYINELLTAHIISYFDISKTDWENMTEEEKGITK